MAHDPETGRKDAATDHPIHELLRVRWSPRAFVEKSLTEAELTTLLEAARWSPSCINEQPWIFLVARRDERERFAQMLDCLAESNQVWARRAGALMIAAAKRNYTRDGKENPVHLYDLGQAVAHMTVQATAMGLHVHQMRGFNLEKATETYAVPDTHELGSAIAIGHVAPPSSLPDGLRERELQPRQRKALSDFVYAGRWGQRKF
jgi:nitroreductase